MDRTSRTTLPSLALTTISALAAGLASGIAVHALLRRPRTTPVAAQPSLTQPPSVTTSASPASSPAEIIYNPVYPLSSATASPQIASAPTLDHDSPRWSQLGLTYAEIRIAQRIVKGRSFSSIAAELGVTDQSVRKTASRIYRKAGVGRRQDFTAQMGAPAAVSPSALPATPATSPAPPTGASPIAAASPTGILPASPVSPDGAAPTAAAGKAATAPGSAATPSAAPYAAPPASAASFPPPCVCCPTSPLAQTPNGNIPSTMSQ